MLPSTTNFRYILLLRIQKRFKTFIAALHVYRTQCLPLFGSRLARYCHAALKIMPLMLLLSWPFFPQSFNACICTLLLCSNIGGFLPNYLTNSYLLNKASESSFSSVGLRVSGIISPHVGPGTMLLISDSYHCSHLEIRTPPLLSDIIPHTLAIAVRQEVFLGSDEGVLSSSSLFHSLSASSFSCSFWYIHFSSAVVLMQH